MLAELAPSPERATKCEGECMSCESTQGACSYLAPFIFFISQYSPLVRWISHRLHSVPTLHTPQGISANPLSVSIPKWESSSSIFSDHQWWTQCCPRPRNTDKWGLISILKECVFEMGHEIAKQNEEKRIAPHPTLTPPPQPNFPSKLVIGKPTFSFFLLSTLTDMLWAKVDMDLSWRKGGSRSRPKVKKIN